MKKTTLTLLTALIVFFVSCKKDKQESLKTFEGAKVSVGNGKAWSWIQMKTDTEPETVGISFTQDAFVNLPAENANLTPIEFILDMPSQIVKTPFDHIVIDWNPNGHPPVGIYDKPHFDFHFYLITEAERQQIPAYHVDSTKFQFFPLPAYFPANYIPIPEGEEKMGKHWADITSPELSHVNPEPFTQTFILGSYNGKITFYEPMATLSFMATTTSFIRDIPQPSKFAKSGYYPTKLSITRSGLNTEVKFTGFINHQQS